MVTALVNARVLTAAGLDEDCAVLIDGDLIVELTSPREARRRAFQQVDLRDRYLLPGFIDCQVNGGGGVLFNDQPNTAGIARIASAHRRFGTTALLPTLISDSTAVMQAAIAAVDAAIAQGVPGVVGIHLEGPYLAAARKGVHDASKFQQPGAEALELTRSLHNGVCLLTVAPERLAIDDLCRLAESGVLVAAGHSAASYAQVRAALDAGLRGFTHLFNAMSPLQTREPGVVGAALDDAASWCGLIVDGHHVHPATLRIALAAKPRGKIFLVTDAMPSVGSDIVSFKLNGQTIVCADAQCRTATGALAGSGLDMASAVRNAISMLGVDLAEAVRMASTYPAAFLGLDRSHGQIAPGYRADLVAMNADFSIDRTWIAGADEGVQS